MSDTELDLGANVSIATDASFSQSGGTLLMAARWRPHDDQRRQRDLCRHHRRHGAWRQALALQATD